MPGSPKAMKICGADLTWSWRLCWAVDGRSFVAKRALQIKSFLHLCHVLLHFFNPSSLPMSLSEPYTLYFKSKARSNMLELGKRGKKMHFCGQWHTTVLQRNCYSVLGRPHNDSSCCNQDSNGSLKQECFQNHLQLTQTYLKFKSESVCINTLI